MMRLAAVALLVGSMAWPAAASEELHYEWEVSGIARLVLPGTGSGLLSTSTQGDEIRTELLITTGGTDDFFRYGSSLDRASGALRSAWSGYRFGKRSKNRDQEVTGEGVVDIASGILHLRAHQPVDRRLLTIWSDGKLYPVVVVNEGLETVQLASGPRQAHHYTIRGRKLVGEREWKGALDLWLGLDPAATPVKIEVARAFSRVELRLLDAI